MDVSLQPRTLEWARKRSGLSLEELAGKMHVPQERLETWEKTGQLSFAQAERLALI